MLLVMHDLLLQSGEERFHRRVIPAGFAVAHRTGDAAPGQQPPVTLAGVLHAAVGMRRERFTEALPGDGRTRAVHDEPAVDPLRHPGAGDFAHRRASPF
ncbi:MAG: hypothetical protein WBC44_16695 [Planctomycetaceae bacterium]